MSQKRVVAIHDISCFGKCSLTVALPILSACAVECAVIPTAVLSTHTGGFTGYTFRDLTDDILEVASHWRKEGITADAFYTGYLGSAKQAEIVKGTIEMLRTQESLVIVDPAMADNGRLYKGFDIDFPLSMLSLCQSADIVVPNITEACLLTGIEYKESPYTEEYIETLIQRMSEITGADIVLTGVCFDENRIGAAIYEQGELRYALTRKIPVLYHGTGDVFASAMTGALLNDRSLQAAVQIAVNFTRECIEKTLEENPEREYGVNFESAISDLFKVLE
ncbi:MAG: pyridoxamine kinase [Acutalibacteraceae bacterium]|nr:pyridoxamine kinase [Acutalibacteraceae bacterium]